MALVSCSVSFEPSTRLARSSPAIAATPMTTTVSVAPRRTIARRWGVSDGGERSQLWATGAASTMLTELSSRRR